MRRRWHTTTWEIRPLTDERETLEHRRDRLRELLRPGTVSEELGRLLRQTLDDVEQRLEVLGTESASQSRQAA